MKKFIPLLLIVSLILGLYPCNVMAQELTFDSISIESIDAVTKNLSLASQINGVNYSWSTSDENVITSEGIVKRPMLGEADATVTVKATGGGGSTEFVVTVKAFQNVQEVITKTKNQLNFSVLSHESINEVTRDLYLPATWQSGAYIYWESSNENLISVSGKTGVVKRPPFGEGISCVILTAYIGLDNQIESKSFLVRVKEQEIGRNYSRALKKAMQDFDKEFLSAQNLLAVRNNLVIPQVKNENITVSFLSQNPQVLTDNGVVTRSVYTDNIANFIVTLTYGYEKTHLSYSMIVKAIADDELTQKLEEDLSWIVSKLEENHDLSKLTESMTFPQKGPNGSTLRYDSSNTSVLTNSGTVQQSQTEQRVTLTIYANLNDKTLSRSLVVVIPKQNSYQVSQGASSGGSSYGGSEIFGGSGEVLLETNLGVNYVQTLFYDVAQTHWASKEIYGLKEKNIICGNGNGYFYPDNYLTREELVKMIVLSGGYSTDGEIPFFDVHPTHWSYPYVVSAYTNGIISGKSKELFGCGENVTRQDAAVIMYNILKKKGFDFENLNSADAFEDWEEIGTYARIAVSDMRKAGIINGRDNNEFKPLENLKRSEAAAMIWRLLQL